MFDNVKPLKLNPISDYGKLLDDTFANRITISI